MTDSMYQKNLSILKDKLRIKILSIYIIDDAKKQEYIDLVNSVKEIDILYEIDQRINEVMKDIGRLAADLIQGADREIIVQFKALVNNEIIKSLQKKEMHSKLLEEQELAELEENLEAMLEKI